MKNLTAHFIWILVPIGTTSCRNHEQEQNALLNEADRNFVLNAADEGLFQISAGQVALNNDASAKYAAFGQLMIDSYRLSNQELQSYAADKRLTIPSTLSDSRQLRLDSLAGRKGAALDTVFAAVMVATHSETIRYFEDQTDLVGDNQLKSWIEKKLPLMRQYLDQARALGDTPQ